MTTRSARRGSTRIAHPPTATTCIAAVRRLTAPSLRAFVQSAEMVATLIGHSGLVGCVAWVPPQCEFAAHTNAPRGRPRASAAAHCLIPNQSAVHCMARCSASWPRGSRRGVACQRRSRRRAVRVVRARRRAGRAAMAAPCGPQGALWQLQGCVSLSY